MQLTFLETLYLKNVWVRRILAILLCLAPLFDFARGVMNIPRQRLIDLFVRDVAAHVLAAGGNIYALRSLRTMADQIGEVRYGSAFSNLLLGYTHPPSDTFFDLRYVPFSYPDARLVYAAETILLYALSLVLIYVTLKGIGPRILHWVWPALLFLLFAPARSSIGLGQSDITIFFLIVLAFWAIPRNHNVLAAVALAIATLMKVTPGVFVLYFLWKREWRLAVYTVGAGVVIALASLPTVGLDRYLQFATQIFPAISTGTAYFDNQSLPGLINRLLLDPIYAQGLQSAPSVPILRVLNTAAELALVAIALVFSRGRMGSRRSMRYALEFSLWLLIQPIMSPIAWDHYFTWLLLPITVVLAALLNSRQSITRTVFVLIALAVAVGLTNIGSQVFQTWPEDWQQSPLLYGALVLLFVLCERIEQAHRPTAVPVPSLTSALAEPAIS